MRARKDLADLLERIREARIELIRADTREERLVIRVARSPRSQASADALETELNGVKRQGRFATVDVEVTSNGSASDDDGWSLGDALDDAGRVLEVIGGIALIAPRDPGSRHAPRRARCARDQVGPAQRS